METILFGKRVEDGVSGGNAKVPATVTDSPLDPEELLSFFLPQLQIINDAKTGAKTM